MENKQSEYQGVTWSSRDKKWRTSITKHLGTFDCEVEAHKVYKSYKNRLKLFEIKKGDSPGFDINVIKDIVEEMTGLDIAIKTRKRNFTDARQIYCKIARDENPSTVTTTKIGEIINRDHATVIHSVKKAAIIIEQDPTLMKLYIKIMEVINRIKEDNTVEPQENVQIVDNIEEVYKGKLASLKNDYKKKIDVLQLKNKRLEPILEMLEQLPIDQIHNFQETRLKPFIKMFEARKVLPKRMASKY